MMAFTLVSTAKSGLDRVLLEAVAGNRLIYH